MTASLLHTPHEPTNARTRIIGSRDGVLADATVAGVRLARTVRTVCARAWHWLSRIVTGLGWAAAIVTAAAFVAGYGLGWAEARVVSWALSIVLAAAVLYVVGRNSYQVQLSIAAQRVVTGEPAYGEVRVDNTARRRASGGRLEVPVGYGTAEFALPQLRGHGSFTHQFLVPAARRGIIAVGPARSVRGDPVGLLRRELHWPGSMEVIVHPRTIAIPSMSTGFVRDLDGNPTRDLTASDVAFHAIREYAPGDEPRTIHWKSTAKTGTLMVRQFEETRRSHLVVALALADADYASDDEFELAVSAAGSLGVRAIRDGRTVSVVTSEATPDYAKHTVRAAKRLNTLTPARLLDDLARVERTSAQLHVTELSSVASQGAAGVSVAFVVCGSPVSVAVLRRASTQFALGVQVVAVVCDPGAVPGLRRAGELSVLTIGYLEDLQKSLARSRAA